LSSEVSDSEKYKKKLPEVRIIPPENKEEII
jgi:hypothetical protein